MQYRYAGGTVDVPQEFIDRTRCSLGCSREEACEIYLSDEGYVTNATVIELTEKATGAKKTRQVKPDYTKRALINYFANACRDLRDLPVENDDEAATAVYSAANVEITNPQRIVSFTIGDDQYELTLSRKRKPKKN